MCTDCRCHRDRGRGDRIVPRKIGSRAGGGLFYHWFRRDTCARAVKVACVVGPVLTLINQYDSFLAGDFTPKLFFKSFLTFLVPYSVSSYSSAKSYLEQERSAARKNLCEKRVEDVGG